MSQLWVVGDERQGPCDALAIWNNSASDIPQNMACEDLKEQDVN